MSFLGWWRRFRKTHVYTRRKVKRRARKDGRPWRWKIWPFREADASIPPLDQRSPADFERDLKRAAEDDLATIASRWEDADEELLAEYCDAYEEYSQARREEEAESSEESDARKAYRMAKEEYFQFDPPALDRRWMMLWLIVIGVGEFFLNSTVFQVLGGGRWETYVAALAVGVAIPLFGHWTGHQLRQEHKATGDWLLLGLAPAALFAGLYGLALLRGEFAVAAGQQIQRVFGVEFSSQEFMLIFLLLNILLFFVATVCSFAASHPRAARYRKARAKFRDAKEELSRESAEAAAAADRLERARKRYQRTRSRRQSQYEKLRQEAIDQQQSFEYLSQIYRTENLRARSDGRPECFDLEIPASSVELPEALRNEELQDWDCSDLLAEAEGREEEAGEMAPVGVGSESP